MSEQENFLEKAKTLYINANYPACLSLLVDKLKDHPAIFEGLYLRASTLQKLNQFDASIKDLETCEKINADDFHVFQKKGIAYFMLGDFNQASSNFEKAHSLAQEQYQKDIVQPWISKTKRELAGKNAGTVNGLGALPDSKKAAAESQPKVEARKEEVKDVPMQDQTQSKPRTELKPPASVLPERKCDWYQNNSSVFGTFLVKHPIHKEAVVEFNSNGFVLQSKVDQEKQHVYKLFAEIVPEESKFNITDKKIELVIQKKKTGESWMTLEASNPLEMLQSLPAYPTSSKKAKDWSKVDKECEEMVGKEKPEGEDAASKLFKEIYSNADEDTKRAMIKSYQTSGGTVLSTNWDEVKKKDYEKRRPSPPKGMEWRKYEQ